MDRSKGNGGSSGLTKARGVALDPPGTWCLYDAFFHLLGPLDRYRSFLEIGPGEGEMSRRLCSRGLHGRGVEASATAATSLRRRLEPWIDNGRYAVDECDFTNGWSGPQADLVFCLMVLEHIEDDAAFLARLRDATTPGGLVVVGVPARPEKWSREDHLAGHCRRYEKSSLRDLFVMANLKFVRTWSLGVPVTNMLFPLGNLAITRSEVQTRATLSRDERTELSAFRDTRFKTHFPAWSRLLLNGATMWPVTRLQRLFYGTTLGLTLLAGGRK